MVRLWWRGRKLPGYRERWTERFGYLRPLTARPQLWVHAVSVGEVQAAVPIVRAVGQRYPGLSVVLTTMTPTGAERARQALGERVHHHYAPYDLPGAVRRFLQTVQPRMLLLMETELWPNLIHACYEQGIPVVVANARLSERSAARYRRSRRFVFQLLREITLIAAQGEKDAQRFMALGADPLRVQVTGNVKFDLPISPTLWEQAQALRRLWDHNRPVWIAASTHEGEEELVLDAHAEVRQAVPNSLLVLVPRHPERFAKVAALCRRRGYPPALRSSHQPCPPETAVFLGDTMGELMMFYAASDVAFVGGSLVAVGGHNLIEPAACGRPVLFGPYMFNFEELSRMVLEAGGGRRVQSARELAETVSAWLQDASLRFTMGEKASRVADDNRGAVERLMETIAGYFRADGLNSSGK
jgi:3-deoxy-D-manno-octulosonic-acid transferase